MGMYSSRHKGSVIDDAIDKAIALTIDSSLSSTSTNPVENRAVTLPLTYFNRHGFLNQSQTTLGFNPSTYVFTLSSVGENWGYFRAGLPYTILGNKSIRLVPTGVPSTGLYYIYIDNISGNLASSTIAWDLSGNSVTVATIAWNSSLTPEYILADERHTCLIDRRTHYYGHVTEGTKLVAGSTIADYVLDSATDADKRFSIGEAKIADEDLFFTLSPLAKPNGTDLAYSVFYRTGASAWSWKNSAYPFSYTGSAAIEWDSVGTMTALGNGEACNYYLLLTNYTGAMRFVLIPGQQKYLSPNALTKAYAESFSSLDLSGLPILEAVAVYQFTWFGLNGGGIGLCKLMRAQKITITVSTMTINATQQVVAQSVPIVDDGNYFTTDNVESALQQLGNEMDTHGYHVPTPQTADDAVYLRNDNSWQTITAAKIGAAASSHTHVKANITDFPTSMPASDVSAWAKATTKPSYGYSEVGAAAASHTHSYLKTGGSISSTGEVTQSSSSISLGTNSTGSTGFPSSYGFYALFSASAARSFALWKNSAATGSLHYSGIESDSVTLNGWKTILDSSNYTSYVTPANIGAAAASHNHSAANITSGTLAVARGGTGVTTTKAIALLSYPVGAIYQSTVSTTPATLFGGTWAALGGRMLIGVNTTYTAGLTGGAATHTHTTPNHAHTTATMVLTVAQMPSHKHPVRYTGRDLPTSGGLYLHDPGNGTNTLLTNPAGQNATGGGGSHGHGNTGNAAPTTNSTNGLPPYLAVYMWKRTA